MFMLGDEGMEVGGDQFVKSLTLCLYFLSPLLMGRMRKSCFRPSWNKLSLTPSHFPEKPWRSARG